MTTTRETYSTPARRPARRAHGRPSDHRPSFIAVWGRFLVIVAAYFPFCGGTLQLLDLLAPEADIDMMPTSSAVSAVAVSGLLIWVSCRSTGREGWSRFDPRFKPHEVPEPLRFGVAELSVLPLMLGPGLLAVLLGGGRGSRARSRSCPPSQP